jgi:hypothetical protein
MTMNHGEPQTPNNYGNRPTQRMDTAGQVADEQQAHIAPCGNMAAEQPAHLEVSQLTPPTSPSGRGTAEQPAHLAASQLTPPTSLSGRGMSEQTAHLAASQPTPPTSLSPTRMPPQPGYIFRPVSSLLAAEPTRPISLPAAPPSTSPLPQPRNDWSYPPQGGFDDLHDMDMSEMEGDPDWPWPLLSSTRVDYVEDLHNTNMSEMERDPDWPWPLLSSTRVDYAEDLHNTDMSEMEGEPDWPWPRLSSIRVGFAEDLHDMDMPEMERECDWPWPRLWPTRSRAPMDASPLRPPVATWLGHYAPSLVSPRPLPAWQQPDSPPPSPHHLPWWMVGPFDPPGEDFDDFYDRRLSEMAEEADLRNARERAVHPHAPRRWWHVGNGVWEPSSPSSPQSSRGSAGRHHPVYNPLNPYSDDESQTSDWAPPAQSQPSPLSSQSSQGSVVPETEDSSPQRPPRETMPGEEDLEYHDHHPEATIGVRDRASSVHPPPYPLVMRPPQGRAEAGTGDSSSQRPPQETVSAEEDPAYSDHHGGAGPRAGDRTPPVQPPSRGGWAEP